MVRRLGRDITATMTERIEIHLKYEGPDVENGTMSLQDVIPVLQGLSGAYDKLSKIENSNVTHRIVLSGFRRGSADIILEVYQGLIDNAETIGAIAGLVTGGMSLRGTAFEIMKMIFDVIRIIKHIGADASSERITVENGIVINNSSNVQITVPTSSYKLYKDGKLKKDLDYLTRPLVEGGIDAADFKVRANNGETFSQRVTAEERPYFENKDIEETTTKEMEITAILNSLTKTTNKGRLYLLDGRRVSYRYSGDDYSNFCSIFGTYNGAVKMQCKVKLNEQSEPVFLDILQIERVQQEMFGEAPNPTPK